MDSEIFQRCENCMKDFPAYKMSTHFGYCRRNIKKCQICQELLDINFKEEHQEEFHSNKKCLHCSTEFPSKHFEQHQRKCTSKPKFCEHCQLKVPVNQFQTHLKACQSRTNPCNKCSKPIMKKDFQIHYVSCKGIVQAPRLIGFSQNLFEKRSDPYSQNHMNSNLTPIQRPQMVKVKEKAKQAERFQSNTQQRLEFPKMDYPQQNQKKGTSKNPYSWIFETQQNAPNIFSAKAKEQKKPIEQEVINNQQKRANGSNKQIYKYEPTKPTVKQNKLFESKGVVKRQQGSKEKISSQNMNPKIQQTKQLSEWKSKMPVFNQQRQQNIKKKSPQYKNGRFSNQFASLGLSYEQQMLQQILMRSVKDYTKDQNFNQVQLRRNASKNNEIPYIEGEDFSSEDFIKSQRAIQQQLPRKNKGGR